MIITKNSSVLYVDKELDKQKKESVEKFVLQHPQFQDEFTLLKQTVLEPETVVFEDKASLLRKRGKKSYTIVYSLCSSRSSNRHCSVGMVDAGK